MRVFIALDIPGEIRARITDFLERARPYAPEARWARPEGLHVTLKFVGEVSDARVQEIKSALAALKAEPFAINFSGPGFFPSPKSPRVFWIGVLVAQPLTTPPTPTHHTPPPPLTPKPNRPSTSH